VSPTFSLQVSEPSEKRSSGGIEFRKSVAGGNSLLSDIVDIFSGNERRFTEDISPSTSSAPGVLVLLVSLPEISQP
jgi:hypothetical protein